jgi:hypothetical protein
MVLQEESITTRWWPFLGRTSRKEEKLSESEIVGPPEELDVLSLAEKGLARECTEDFLRPLERTGALHRYNVRRSNNRTQYRLFRDSGEFMMYAEVRLHGREVRFFPYDPSDKENGLFDPDRPAFRMNFDDSKTSWSLLHFVWDSARHPCVKDRREEEVLFVEHSKEKVGDGVNYLLEAEFESKCSEAGGLVDSARYEDDRPYVNRLVTRKAIWNQSMKTLVLDFRQRDVIPSAKNFQVVREESQRIILQHGKIGENTFALDFRAPLSIAQAFAMSITTLFWE